MGDIPRTPRSPTPDLHSMFGLSKNVSLVGKVYKSLLRRHPDKSSPKPTDGKKQEELIISEPIALSSIGHDHHQKNEDYWFSRHSILPRSMSRRPKTPTHSQGSLSRNSNRRCKTPTPKSSYLSSETDFAPASLSRDTSRIGGKAPSRSASLSRNTNRRCTSETETQDNSTSTANMTRNCSPETIAPSHSRNISLKGSTPIIFSQSTVRRKSPPVEKKLECTLEELFFGGVRKVELTRDVILNPGILAQEEETLMIEIKPGWRKGTKLTFEGKGDEKPGYLPGAMIFLIIEKQHPLFKRDGDNLEMVVEIPLVNALAGCTITVPTIGGETMTLSFEDTIISPGYEKVIQGQGMPNSKQDGRRGDLHIKFLINFPTELSDQQREEAVSFLQDCY